MKLKKLLKVLSESTPISIGIDGSCVGSFTDHGCIPAAFLEYRVTSLWIGEFNTGEKKFNITISKKEES